MPVNIAWVIAWNVLLGIGIWDSGGFGHHYTPLAVALMSVALLGSAIFGALVLFYAPFRNWALRPDGQLAAIRMELSFIVFLTGVLGLVTLYACVRGVLA